MWLSIFSIVKTSFKLHRDYILPQTGAHRSTGAAGAMHHVGCLCSFWSNTFAVNAPLEPYSCISIVFSMPMLSNTTNESPCYIFFGAFICAWLYLRGGGQRVQWHLSPCWYVSECLCAYGPFLFISEQRVLVLEQQKDEDSNVRWNAAITPSFLPCVLGEASAFVCACLQGQAIQRPYTAHVRSPVWAWKVLCNNEVTQE